jgi:tetratricopeptide (TPR) repeat protein
MEVGRLDEALAAASRSVGIFEAVVGKDVSAQAPNFGNSLLNQGEVLLRMGRPREAVGAVDRAKAIYVAHGKEDSVLEANIVLAAAWEELGDPARAARPAAEARGLADKDKETAPDLLVELGTVEANLALDRAAGDLALADAEKALAIAEAGVSYLYDLSSARFVLARALSAKGQDPARARQLAEQARDGFNTLHDAARTRSASELLSKRD